jgi:hypothetical protein
VHAAANPSATLSLFITIFSLPRLTLTKPSIAEVPGAGAEEELEDEAEEEDDPSPTAEFPIVLIRAL